MSPGGRAGVTALVTATVIGLVLVVGAQSGSRDAPQSVVRPRASAHLARPGGTHRRVCAAALPRAARCFADLYVPPSGSSTFTSPTGYGPPDFVAAYGTGGAVVPGGEPVGIVDAYDDPNAESDLAAYRTQFGLPPCSSANGCFRKVNQTGGASYPSSDATWALEVSLDLDAVSAICPGCHIVLVEANTADLSDLAAAVTTAVTLGAPVVSNSYGTPEFSGESAFDGSYHHPGVATIVASGDSGFGVYYPAASPWVTAVGGTSLTRAGNQRGWSESAWSGASSGCSAFEPKPAWQADGGCGMRTVADMAADAAPATGAAVYDTFGQSGWVQVGGTSLAAPLVAGIYALGLANQGFNGAAGAYQGTAQFNDVVSGTTGTCSPAYLCGAGPGYDGPTGIGTPEGVQGPQQHEVTILRSAGD